jgi:hypothetical protein
MLLKGQPDFSRYSRELPGPGCERTSDVQVVRVRTRRKAHVEDPGSDPLAAVGRREHLLHARPAEKSRGVNIDRWSVSFSWPFPKEGGEGGSGGFPVSVHLQGEIAMKQGWHS